MLVTMKTFIEYQSHLLYTRTSVAQNSLLAGSMGQISFWHHAVYHDRDCVVRSSKNQNKTDILGNLSNAVVDLSELHITNQLYQVAELGNIGRK